MQVGGLVLQLGDLSDGIGGLVQFEQATKQWQSQVDAKLDGCGEVVLKTSDREVSPTLQTMDRRVATVEGSVDMLGKLRTGTAVGYAAAGPRVDAGVALGMVDFATTVTAGLSALVTPDNEGTLGRHVGEATKAAARLSEAAQTGDVAGIEGATVTLLGTLRTAVKSAGIEPALAKQLDAQFSEMKGLLG